MQQFSQLASVKKEYGKFALQLNWRENILYNNFIDPIIMRIEKYSNFFHKNIF